MCTFHVGLSHRLIVGLCCEKHMHRFTQRSSVLNHWIATVIHLLGDCVEFLNLQFCKFHFMSFKFNILWAVANLLMIWKGSQFLNLNFAPLCKANAVMFYIEILSCTFLYRDSNCFSRPTSVNFGFFFNYLNNLI